MGGFSILFFHGFPHIKQLISLGFYPSNGLEQRLVNNFIRNAEVDLKPRNFFFFLPPRPFFNALIPTFFPHPRPIPLSGFAEQKREGEGE